MKKILCLNLLLSFALNAQTLTLQQSIEKTLQSHPDVKIFTLKTQQSHMGYKSARADYLPQVNLSAEYNPTQTYALPVNGKFHTINDTGWNIGASLKQKIWDFSKTSFQIDASKRDEDISKLSLKDLKVLLASKVKSLYELMVVQSEAIKVREADLHVKEVYYAQAKALFKQGLKTQADTSRFLSAVYSAKDNLAIAKASYEKAKNSLSLYMGEKISDDVDLQRDVIKKDFNFDKNTAKEVLSTNNELKIYNETIQKNVLLHKSAKASHYGSLDLLASYNRVGSLSLYDSQLVGVVLNIPLYSGGRISSEEQNAELGTQIAKQQKSSKELALKEEISNLVLDIRRYDETIAAKKAQLDAAKSTQRVLEGRYKEGLSTYIEVLDASSLVLDAQLGLLEAYYEKTLSIDRIEYLKGKI
ncbi:TolC family protein [Sulfurimonas autotrophica]|uniref:Outer membrane efflux protein n=1 Tax=Sulfurimonas autotrophica (strain ATCC BAA-671 / DSM 16294 / JCM 11897 / OK10) TaxID=563040 RepID=E0UTT2_SULAO|nr:TolC family protein [Sulfurimonas autotrophica]ADN09376.1 outer membrane efflux protein [Sulfurimonas autotrophica DSM 16294]